MKALKSVGIVAIFMILAVLAYQSLIGNKSLPTEPSTAQLGSDSTIVAESKPVSARADVSKEDTIKEPPAETITSNSASELDNLNTQLSLNYPPLAAYDIGNEPVSDEELINLVNRLNNDPALMAELISELRAETNPERLKRLVYILGATANSAVLPVATELIYSGVPSSRDAGLTLLSRLAPNNPEALSIASNLLVSETEPDVLIATMNVMAQPANASPELRESLVTQITPLSNHEVTNVRSISVSILSRLTDDPSASPVFYNALLDAEAHVRRAAAYAYANFPYHTSEASQKLLDMAEDPYEDAEVRGGAIFALKNNSPDELTLSRLEEASLAMRREAAIKRQQRNDAK